MPYSKVTLYGIAIKSIEDYTIAQVEENKKMEDLSVNLQDVVNKISEIGINNEDKGDQGEQIEKKYIEDKLIARYDGIENTREGHKDNTTIWEDISGNNRDLIMCNSGITKTVFWEKDGLVNAEESAMCLKTDLIPELQTLKSETIEIVLYCTKDGTSVSRDVITAITANHNPWVGLGIDIHQNQVIAAITQDKGGCAEPKRYSFKNGEKIYMAIVLEEYNNGNLICIHSYTHKFFTKIPKEQVVEQISLTKDIIFNITNYPPSYIRIPYGITNENVNSILKEEKLENVLWNVDSLDWKYKDKNNTVEHIKKNIHGNDIILMHDILKSSVDSAKEIIDYYTSLGYKFVTVDEFYHIKNITKSNK